MYSKVNEQGLKILLTIAKNGLCKGNVIADTINKTTDYTEQLILNLKQRLADPYSKRLYSLT